MGSTIRSEDLCHPYASGGPNETTIRTIRNRFNPILFIQRFGTLLQLIGRQFPILIFPSIQILAYVLSKAAGSDGRCNTLWSFDMAIGFKRTDPLGLQFAFT
jgi:hypothetical protein